MQQNLQTALEDLERNLWFTSVYSVQSKLRVFPKTAIMDNK